MSDEEKLNKHYESSPEKTLITLEQLSQTIEVMTSVVNRLRQHLNEQLEDQIEKQRIAKKDPLKANINPNTGNLQRDCERQDELQTKSVLEIRQQDTPTQKKSRKIVH
tara:strand:+ start:427 stop:750 length:324 start_codon:yes stop_codon:yes gene_type:complete